MLLSEISHRILRDEVATRRISIRAIVLPLAEFKCDLFFVADLFLSFLSLSLLAFILLYSGVLSWSSVSLRRFIAPFDRSSQFDRSVKCIRTKLSKATVSNNLDSAYECIAKVGLFDLFLLDWRIRNESNLRSSKSCGTNHETNISSQFVVFYTSCRAPVYLFIKSGSDFCKWVFKFSLQLHCNSMLIVQKIIFHSKIPVYHRHEIMGGGGKCEVFAWNCFSRAYSISSKLKDHR